MAEKFLDGHGTKPAAALGVDANVVDDADEESTALLRSSGCHTERSGKAIELPKLRKDSLEKLNKSLSIFWIDITSR